MPDAIRQEVQVITDATADARTILPISPVAAKTPMSFPRDFPSAALATAEKATGWNTPNAMLESTNERNTETVPREKPRVMKPMP